MYGRFVASKKLHETVKVVECPGRKVKFKLPGGKATKINLVSVVEDATENEWEEV